MPASARYAPGAGAVPRLACERDAARRDPLFILLAVVMMRQQRGWRAEVLQAIRSKPKPRRCLGALNQFGRLREVVAGRRQRAKRWHGDHIRNAGAAFDIVDE